MDFAVCRRRRRKACRPGQAFFAKPRGKRTRNLNVLAFVGSTHRRGIWRTGIASLIPTWTDVKAKLDSFDRAGLLGLVQNLYTAQADTRTFLHARFGLTEDVLRPSKRTIEQWLDPDVFGKEDISVSKAKKAISDYQKAVDQPEGLTELMVFYGEVATDFCDEFGMQDEGLRCPRADV